MNESFQLVKNGIFSTDENARWQAIASQLCADFHLVAQERDHKKEKFEHLLAEQAKHPDMEKVERAVKHLESKKAYEAKWCVGKIVIGDYYSCSLGGSLGDGNTMKANNIPLIDGEDYY